MKYKAELEQILTVALQKREPLLSTLQISDDSKFAVIQVAREILAAATYSIRQKVPT